MQMNRCTFGILVSILLLTALTSVSSTAKAAGSRPSDSPIAETTLQMSQEELQAAVISYANRFIATIGQAAFDLETAIQTKEGRLVAAARKVYSLSAVAEIAAGPRPGPALLDLVVLTTLNRRMWVCAWTMSTGSCVGWACTAPLGRIGLWAHFHAVRSALAWAP